ncbi:MAG: hypothetical protein AAF593_13770 [Planctomycetota bacterium]
MSDPIRSFRRVRGTESRLYKIVLLGILLVVVVPFLLPMPSKPEHIRLRVRSMSNMNTIINAVYVYESEFGAYPNDLSVLQLDDLIHGEDGSINPREGFSGYHFRAPEVPFDESEMEELRDLAILFEVRDDGTIVYDSGLIGYGGGYVNYISDEE